MPAPLVITALWLMLPAYVANMLATLVGGGRPVDGGRNWSDGRRVFGDGKTWRGLLLPPVLVVPIVWLLRELRAPVFPADWALDGFGPGAWWVVLSASLGLGALLGDMTFSFLKRRRGMPSGARWLGPDQLDFVVGSWVVGLAVSSLLHAAGATEGNWFLDAFEWQEMVLVAILTPGLHLLVNVIGYKIGAKKVPW